MRDYQRDVLLPVTAQLSHRGAVAASLLEQHTAELSAAQEWDSEWNSQGLLSRLTPEVGPLLIRGSTQCVGIECGSIQMAVFCSSGTFTF